MPRLFIGSFLDPESRGALTDLASDNQHLPALWSRKVRWVASDRLHLTWLFMGEIESDSIPAVAGELEDCLASFRSGAPQPEICYDRLRLWPSERKARLGVLTPHSTPESIGAIAGSIADRMRRFLPHEERKKLKPFQPHITLFRLGRPLGNRGGRAEAGARPSIGAIHVQPGLGIMQTVKEICLIESDLGGSPSGRGYIRLTTVPMLAV